PRVSPRGLKWPPSPWGKVTGSLATQAGRDGCGRSEAREAVSAYWAAGDHCPAAWLQEEGGGDMTGRERTAEEGRALRGQLVQSQRRAKRRAFLLVLPLLAFVAVSFLIPIGQMLYRSIHNDAFSSNMPELTAWFAQSPVGTPPDEAAFAALAADLA